MKRGLAIGLAALACAALAVFLLWQRTPLAMEDALAKDEPSSIGAAEPRGPLASMRTAAKLETETEDLAIDCLEALAMPEASSRMMREQKQLRIQRFFEEERLAPLERLLAADIAGYVEAGGGAVLGDPDGLPPRLFWAYGTPRPPDARKLTAAERRRLAAAFEREGLAGLHAFGDAGLLQGLFQGLFQATWKDATLAGHLIRKHGDALFDGWPMANDRHPLGPIGLHELAMAVAAGVAPVHFERLLDASDVEADAAWWNGANLAKVAAVRQRPELLRLLMDKGVDPLAPPLWGPSRSALDDLASRTPRDTAFGDVAALLTLAGDQPRLPSTLSLLGELLPDLHLPPLHPETVAALPRAQDAAEAVAALDAEWSAKVAAATRLEQRCASLASDRWLENDAGREATLALRQRQQKALERREQRMLDMVETLARMTPATTAADPSADAESRALLRQVRKVQEAVLDGRWDEAIAIADRLGGNLHRGLLYIALKSDAPLAVLSALVSDNGGLLPQDAAQYLAMGTGGRRDAAATAEALEPFGFDPHYVDRLGRNAFWSLADGRMDSEAAWRYAEYLASRSVTPKPSAFGMDPLHRMMRNLLDWPMESGARIRFARFLIDLGAPVEPGHVELAAMLAAKNDAAYQRLIDIVPELAS